MQIIHEQTNNGYDDWNGFFSTKVPRRCFNEIKTLDQSLISTSILTTPAHSTRSRVIKELSRVNRNDDNSRINESTYDDGTIEDLHNKTYYKNLCCEFIERRIRDKAKIKYQRGKIRLLKNQLRTIIKG